MVAIVRKEKDKVSISWITVNRNFKMLTVFLNTADAAYVLSGAIGDRSDITIEKIKKLTIELENGVTLTGT